MEIWLAFSSFEEMGKAHDYPIKGVLTNPTVISALEMNWKEAVTSMNEIGDLPLGLQVVSTQRNEMIEEINAFARLIDKKQLTPKPLSHWRTISNTFRSMWGELPMEKATVCSLSIRSRTTPIVVRRAQ